MSAHRRNRTGGLSAAVALLITSITLAATAVPVVAQDDPTSTVPPTTVPTTAPTTTAPPTTTPSTTAPSTTAPSTTAPSTTASPTTASPTTAPSTTQPAGTDPSTTVTPTTDPDGDDPGEETTSTLDPDHPAADDPLLDEEPPDTVPEVDVTVPVNPRYANQPDFEPPRVLWGNVRQAETKLEGAEAAHRDAVARVKVVRLRTKEVELDLAALDQETLATLDALQVAEDRLRARALQGFLAGDRATLAPDLDHDELLQAMAQQTMVESVFAQDDALIAEFRSLRESLDVDTRLTIDRLALLASLETEMVDEVGERRSDIDQAQLELRAFEAGSEVFVPNLVFPIDGDVELPLIDSWGFPRMLGTPDEHWHEGIDVFAPHGTPLVAAERGVITRVGEGRLGGLKLWIRGESGIDWYYAHLAAFATGLREGQVVEAGELVGYVGTTGNAVGTPPHLHLQMHPGGGRPINPYPVLKVRLELDAEAEAAAADQR